MSGRVRLNGSAHNAAAVGGGWPVWRLISVAVQVIQGVRILRARTAPATPLGQHGGHQGGQKPRVGDHAEGQYPAGGLVTEPFQPHQFWAMPIALLVQSGQITMDELVGEKGRN